MTTLFATYGYVAGTPLDLPLLQSSGHERTRLEDPGRGAFPCPGDQRLGRQSADDRETNAGWEKGNENGWGRQEGRGDHGVAGGGVSRARLQRRKGARGGGDQRDSRRGNGADFFRGRRGRR